MANGSAAKVAAKPKSEGFFSRVAKFIRESYVETFHKSSWPSSIELRQFTVIVIFAVVVVAIWIGGIDFVVGRIVENIHGGTGVR